MIVSVEAGEVVVFVVEWEWEGRARDCSEGSEEMELNFESGRLIGVFVPVFPPDLLLKIESRLKEG